MAMVFILRADRSPARVVRETDEGGYSRTFWLWRDGAWVVVTRFPDGTIDSSSDRSLGVSLEPGDNVTLVRVVHPPLTPTLPAPAPSFEDGRDAISSVVPCAARSDEELEETATPRRASGG